MTVIENSKKLNVLLIMKTVVHVISETKSEKNTLKLNTGNPQNFAKHLFANVAEAKKSVWSLSNIKKQNYFNIYIYIYIYYRPIKIRKNFEAKKYKVPQPERNCSYQILPK